MKDAGTPLATWLTVLLALIGLFLMYHEQQQAEKVVTPEQVEEIVTRVVDELNVETPTESEPATDRSKGKPKTPGKKREPRSGP